MHTQPQPSHSAGRRSVWLPALVGLVALALATAACSSGGGDSDQLADTESIDESSSTDESRESGDSGDSGDSGESGDSGDATTEGDESGDQGSGEVLGTTQATMRANAIDNRSTPIRIDVIGLERHGDLVELALVLTNEATEPTDDSDPQDFGIDSMFGDDDSASGGYDASAIGLVDGEAQQLYLPAFDSEGSCLCSGGFGATDTPPGGTLSIDATYGGVPDDVEELDVHVPNFPAITGVPVQ